VNGRKAWFELSNSMLELPGQPRLLLSIFRDISQAQEIRGRVRIHAQELC